MRVLSKPRGKSYPGKTNPHELKQDINVNLPKIHANSRPKPKLCFNPNCEYKGTRWIGIIGRLMDFNGQVVPYCLCENCYSLFKNSPSILFRLPINKQNSVPKPCYNRYCSNKASHWIKIINASLSLANYDVSYCICDECYAFFEKTREDRPKESRISKYEEERPINISTEDLCHLLESSKSYIDGACSNKREGSEQEASRSLCSNQARIRIRQHEVAIR
jgi:hypothetical protein